MEYYATIECRYEDGFTFIIRKLIDAKNDRQAYRRAINLTRMTALESHEPDRFVKLTSLIQSKDPFSRKEVRFNSRTVDEMQFVDTLIPRLIQ